MVTLTQPQLGVGAIVFHRHKVLLVKRANPPCAGEWAIPGGKVRLGETLQQAAERELKEETGITVQAKEPVFAFDLIEQDTEGNYLFHYVVVDLAAKYIEGDVSAASDASEARWFSPAELDDYPVNATTRKLLQRYPDFIF